MADLSITVPDALAEDVRRLDVAVEAVCQRALLDAVAARAPRAARGVDVAAPVLTYLSRAVVAYVRGLGPAPTSVDLLQGLASEGDALAASAAAGAPRGGNEADPVDAVVGRAVDIARDLGGTVVGSEHLLLALATGAPTEVVVRALHSHGVEPARVRLATVSMIAGFELARSSGGLAGAGAE